jgi:hypothetical protein
MVSEREPLEDQELIAEVLDVREVLEETDSEDAVAKIKEENEGARSYIVSTCHSNRSSCLTTSLQVV